MITINSFNELLLYKQLL